MNGKPVILPNWPVIIPVNELERRLHRNAAIRKPYSIFLFIAGSGNGVFAQRYDSDGNPVGSEFQVNTYTAGDQFRSDIAIDAVGNIIVVWSSYLQDGSFFGVFAQRYDSNGNPVGSEFQVNTYTTDNQFLRS